MRHKYFSGLNYTLGNEDSNFEIQLINKLKPKNVVAVCGSGARSLPLAQENVQNLTIIDLSSEQIMLAKLREATYKQLNYEEFILFWGYYPTPPKGREHEREQLFKKLDIDDSTKFFFKEVFLQTKFHSLLYLGKWEQTFHALAKVNRLMLGENFDRILSFTDLEEQRSYYKNSFPHFRWKLVLLLLGNKTMFNALLYKGNFIKKNYPESHFEYYLKAFDHLFSRTLAQKSFFLHLCFYGKLNSFLGLPIESHEEIFNQIKSSTASIQYHTADFINYLEATNLKFDFVSLSDVPSYFTGELEDQFMQKIKNGLNSGAIVVNRYYLKKPICDLSGFEDITKDFQKEIDSELVQMYRIHIYKFKGQV